MMLKMDQVRKILSDALEDPEAPEHNAYYVLKTAIEKVLEETKPQRQRRPR